MTKDEVQAAIGGKAVDDGGGNLIVRAPQDVAGFRFDDVTYVFKSGRLVAVTFYGKSVNFYALEDALNSALGQPVATDEDPPSRTYVDRVKGNSVRASRQWYGVILAYREIPKGF